MTALSIISGSLKGGFYFYLWAPVLAVLSYLRFVLVVQPLETIYLHGPRMLGCWEGQTEADICVSLAPRTDARFWTDNPQECKKVIYNNIYSWILISEYLIGFALIWMILKGVYAWWWRRRLMGDLETLVHQMTNLAALKMHQSSSLPPIKTH
jgi:hypothetical protein